MPMSGSVLVTLDNHGKVMKISPQIVRNRQCSTSPPIKGISPLSAEHKMNRRKEMRECTLNIFLNTRQMNYGCDIMLLELNSVANFLELRGS
jgi:hypothetical protein